MKKIGSTNGPSPYPFTQTRLLRMLLSGLMAFSMIPSEGRAVPFKDPCAGVLHGFSADKIGEQITGASTKPRNLVIRALPAVDEDISNLLRSKGIETRSLKMKEALTAFDSWVEDQDDEWVWIIAEELDSYIWLATSYYMHALSLEDLSNLHSDLQILFVEQFRAYELEQNPVEKEKKLRGLRGIFNPYPGSWFARQSESLVQKYLPGHFLEKAENEDPSFAFLRDGLSLEGLAQYASQHNRSFEDAIRSYQEALSKAFSEIDDLANVDASSAIVTGADNGSAADPNYEAAVESQMMDFIHITLLTLTPREERVLRLYFGIGPDNPEPLNFREIGRQFGLTGNRVSQIAEKALRKFRHPSRSQRLTDMYDQARGTLTPDDIKRLVERNSNFASFSDETILAVAMAVYEQPETLARLSPQLRSQVESFLVWIERSDKALEAIEKAEVDLQHLKLIANSNTRSLFLEPLDTKTLYQTRSQRIGRISTLVLARVLGQEKFVEIQSETLDHLNFLDRFEEDRTPMTQSQIETLENLTRDFSTLGQSPFMKAFAKTIVYEASWRLNNGYLKPLGIRESEKMDAALLDHRKALRAILSFYEELLIPEAYQALSVELLNGEAFAEVLTAAAYLQSGVSLGGDGEITKRESTIPGDGVVDAEQADPPAAHETQTAEKEKIPVAAQEVSASTQSALVTFFEVQNIDSEFFRIVGKISDVFTSEGSSNHPQGFWYAAYAIEQFDSQFPRRVREFQTLLGYIDSYTKALSAHGGDETAAEVEEIKTQAVSFFNNSLASLLDRMNQYISVFKGIENGTTTTDMAEHQSTQRGQVSQETLLLVLPELMRIPGYSRHFVNKTTPPSSRRQSVRRRSTWGLPL